MGSGPTEIREAGLDVVVGRQPIFDRTRSVVGYELLFRRLADASAFDGGDAGDLMTADVLFSSVSIGVDRLVGNTRAFVNADRGVLTGELRLVLPPERVVVEVLETVEPDAEIIEGCRRLVSQGYTLALDDFVWSDEFRPLLELASIVKVDLTITQPEELPKLLELCAETGTHTLAEKIETPAQLLNCVELGFEYFQGYLLSRPDIVSGRAHAPDLPARLELVSKLVEGECDLRQIEAIVERAPAMAHQLLELASIGSAHGTRRAVRTLREALVIVGWRRLQSWAALLLLVDRKAPSTEGAVTALVRARMSELLAADEGSGAAGLAFTAGMVSAFDLLLGMDIREVLGSLTLSAELREAVLGGDTSVARVVADVAGYQLGEEPVAPLSGIDERTVYAAWSEAMVWAVGVAQPAV